MQKNMQKMQNINCHILHILHSCIMVFIFYFCIIILVYWNDKKASNPCLYCCTLLTYFAYSAYSAYWQSAENAEYTPCTACSVVLLVIIIYTSNIILHIWIDISHCICFRMSRHRVCRLGICRISWLEIYKKQNIHLLSQAWVVLVFCIFLPSSM